MHRLLRRQLKRHLGLDNDIPPDLDSLIQAVDAAYCEFENDRAMLERSIELTSQELLQVNAQLRAIIPDSFLRLDLSGIILDYKIGSTAHDYIPDADPVGKPIQTYLPESVIHQFQAAMWQVRATRQALEIEHDLLRNGEVQVYEVRLLSLLDNQVVAIVRDITTRKRTESALRESEQRFRQQAQELQSALSALKRTQSQLIQSEKMSSLGQLVAGIAHEINNPMNFISGNLGHLRNYSQELVGMIQSYQMAYPQPLPAIQAQVEDIDLDFILEDLNKLNDSISTGVERIRQIVVALRNFSRLDEADMKSVDIHEGITSTLTILKHRLDPWRKQAGIEVIYDYQDLPLVCCYPSLLNQVFMNLIGNAIDALEEYLLLEQKRSPLLTQPLSQYQSQEEPQEQSLGQSQEQLQQKPFQGCITIVTERSLRSGWICIRIRDNGPGIDPTVQSKIFDPFFTTKPVGKGTGLGLAISHQIIVEKHQGHLTCRSSPGQGTEFVIEIPMGACQFNRPLQVDVRD